MRKPIHERKSDIALHELAEHHEGVLPYAYLGGTETEVTFAIGYEGEQGTNSSFTVYEADVVREIRDQLDAWLEQHEE